uniref:Uncharacterized protein n=1 Tax=Pyricularia oryzae (strain P131) TaxID=1143193 RepID=L7IXZ7_PYRO1
MADTHGKLNAVDCALVRCHGIFFTGKGTEGLEKARKEFLSNLDLAVAKGARRWLEAGYQIAVTNLCALFGYDLPANVLIKAFDARQKKLLCRKSYSQTSRLRPNRKQLLQKSRNRPTLMMKTIQLPPWKLKRTWSTPSNISKKFFSLWKAQIGLSFHG